MIGTACSRKDGVPSFGIYGNSRAEYNGVVAVGIFKIGALGKFGENGLTTKELIVSHLYSTALNGEGYIFPSGTLLGNIKVKENEDTKIGESRKTISSVSTTLEFPYLKDSPLAIEFFNYLRSSVTSDTHDLVFFMQDSAYQLEPKDKWNFQDIVALEGTQKDSDRTNGKMTIMITTEVKGKSGELIPIKVNGVQNYRSAINTYPTYLLSGIGTGLTADLCASENGCYTYRTTTSTTGRLITLSVIPTTATCLRYSIFKNCSDTPDIGFEVSNGGIVTIPDGLAVGTYSYNVEVRNTKNGYKGSYCFDIIVA